LSRNYGWGHRDMSVAGERAMRETGASFATVATTIERFEQFKQFAKNEGIGRMERVSPELVQEYGSQVAERVERGELSPAYAQNLVSSVNTVMNAATRGEWRSVSPTKDCNIQHRDNVRSTPTPERINTQSMQLAERQAAVINLAQDLGLRSKEASLLNAKHALSQAVERGVVSVSDGTKGGREREIPITHERQIETLREAAQAQGEARAVMPPEQNWREWREGGLREAREAVAEAAGARGLHDLRATYAAKRYQAICGHPAPCNGGTISDRAADRAAREQIAQELGHGRIDVVSAYIGSSK